MEKSAVYRIMDENAVDFDQMSDLIWDYAETGFREHRSMKLQKDYLEQKGFRITSPVAEMETAFIAEYGSGKPVIAILGEYDALPNLSQEANHTQPVPVPGQEAGHGCGHHLLGCAGVEAACAVQYAMNLGAWKGTVRYYGCPAEEGGGGKVFLVRSGAFADVDAAISWHPFTSAGLMGKALSCVMVEFEFKGTASHASGCPELGRSALDAAELMNVGTQFLREHIPAGGQIQYAFLDAGGPKPNIVPDHARLKYTIRASNLKDTRNIFDRVCKIAKGAAMMTETQALEPKVKNAYSSILPNRTLGKLVLNAMEELYPVHFSSDEIIYAAEFSEIVHGTCQTYNDSYDAEPNGVLSATTDFGDVSWVVPSVAFASTCYVNGTAMHSWDLTAQGKASGAHRGMHTAAKVMFSCLNELYTNPGLLESARKDFEAALDGQTYQTMLPEQIHPPKLP